MSMQHDRGQPSRQEVPENRFWQKVIGKLEALGLSGQIKFRIQLQVYDKHTHSKTKLIVWLAYEIDHSFETSRKIYEGLS